MKETEKAYLAGIIDGEGCIYIQFVKTCHRYQLCLNISNTNVKLMEWLGARWDIKPRVDKTQRDKGWKDKYSWTAHGYGALAILRQVYPYLVMKGSQAIVAFVFGRTLQPIKSNIKITSKNRSKRVACYNYMRSLNQRGFRV